MPKKSRKLKKGGWIQKAIKKPGALRKELGVKAGEKINLLAAKKLENNGLKEIYVSSQSLYGKYLHKNISIGEDIFNIGTEIDEANLLKFLDNKIYSIEISKTNSINKAP